jgi:hypothetical protein
MIRLLIATLVGLVAGLSASPEPPPRPPERVAVVVDGSGPGAPQRIAAARRTAKSLGAVLRIPRTLREQVAVTTALAARGYERVYVSGLEAPYATAPLAGRGEMRHLSAVSRRRG